MPHLAIAIGAADEHQRPVSVATHAKGIVMIVFPFEAYLLVLCQNLVLEAA